MTYHVVDDAVLEDAHRAIQTGHPWMAYNDVPYFLERGDVFFFETKAEGLDFARDNVSDEDRYHVIRLHSLLDLWAAMGTDRDFSHVKLNQMNLENLHYLQDQLKHMGFGDKLNEQLQKEMGLGQPNFQLNLESDINGKAFAAVLNFRQSGHTDRYFFNSYHASLQRKDGEMVDQAFYLNKGRGVTAKEAFNLLDGRAVFKELANKEGQTYHAWIQLDFEKRDKHNNHEVKQFHENYGFDLKDAVGKYALKEMDGGEKQERLLQSLEKGNLQAVTVSLEGKEQRLFLEANPQYKSVGVYDESLHRVQKENLPLLMTPEAAAKALEVSARKEVNGKEIAAPEKQQGKDVKPSVAGEEGTPAKKGKGVKELLPKKERVSNKQGVKVG